MSYNQTYGKINKSENKPVQKAGQFRRLIHQLGDELYQVSAKDNRSARHLDKARRIVDKIQDMDLGEMGW